MKSTKRGDEPMIDLSKKKVLVTGGYGFLGKHVCNKLANRGVTVVRPPRLEFDLSRMDDTRLLFSNQKPDVVIHLAADVGGIQYNKAHPGRVFYENMSMGINVIEECRRADVEKLVFVSTVCAYPKHCRTPFVESDL